MVSPTDMKAWKLLEEHYQEIEHQHMRDMFSEDPHRAEKFTATFNDIVLDYSKNRINEKTLQLLLQLAEEGNLPGWIERMFRGDHINHTEHRSVLHIALRQQTDEPIYSDGRDVMPEVKTELHRMEIFCEAVRRRRWLGTTGQPITDIVNIGIGGSDRGPEMAVEALWPYGYHDIKLHFVSNVDENQILDTLDYVNPETTLFIISSKSFTTQDTMINAQFARDWFLNDIKDESQLAKHFVAVTANIEAAKEFGVARENIFAMWDWVGGRYSIWSSIGLSLAIYIGMTNFRKFLSGAYEMDQHFRTAPLQENLPVLLGLLGVWYNNFFDAQSYVMLPYDQHLHKFPAYLQQADMESNGKQVDREGKPVAYSTGPVIFGEIGISAQHAFYQLLHQGTKLVPADIIAPITNFRCIRKHHRVLMSNVFAQAEALMKGKTEAEARAELEAAGMKEAEIRMLLPYKVFPGNKPTNTIIFDTLDPRTLGSLVAMYEHKIFVQGVIWNINSFDQWGVELGKQLAQCVLSELENNEPVDVHDSSTNFLVNYYKKRRNEIKQGCR